jgi:hypothetical protein
MRLETIVGGVLVTGLVVFMVGASAWRLQYEGPLRDTLPLIHNDRRRRAWIHLWMTPAMFVTTAGIAGFTATMRAQAFGVALMACVVYAMGAVSLLVSLAFRLTVVPWAAERMVEEGNPPEAFPPLDDWAGSLYVMHMASAYTAFALLGAAALLSDNLPTWLGWLGVGWGVGFLVGFVVTRFAGPFNPPFLAHTFTAVLGVTLLLT